MVTSQPRSEPPRGGGGGEGGYIKRVTGDEREDEMDQNLQLVFSLMTQFTLFGICYVKGLYSLDAKNYFSFVMTHENTITIIKIARREKERTRLSANSINFPAIEHVLT